MKVRADAGFISKIDHRTRAFGFGFQGRKVFRLPFFHQHRVLALAGLIGRLSGIEGIVAELLAGYARSRLTGCTESGHRRRHIGILYPQCIKAAPPDSIQGKAKAGLKEIWMAETKAQANKAFDTFVRDFAAKYPKAVAALENRRESLLAFYGLPAEYWMHIRSQSRIAQGLLDISVVPT
ncbi:hypothetical protein A1507_14545 [Methylomonas koyamae]|uniref:Mutator family transposase n=1 Tax=Methylomonas koyamae TaxID=702114 RepID=A0A177NBB2_9GAMM|nr:transposase [Methylomonas koyamae]OAI15121.1 hypothetical protein A1507_14545 [Methylomonas koyamae]